MVGMTSGTFTKTEKNVMNLMNDYHQHGYDDQVCKEQVRQPGMPRKLHHLTVMQPLKTRKKTTLTRIYIASYHYYI